MLANIEKFFSAIRSVVPAYRHQSFIYAAVKSNGEHTILKAAVVLGAQPFPFPNVQVELENLRAGHYRLKEDLKVAPVGLIEQALAGRIETPHGDLLFPPDPDKGYGATYDPFHSIGNQSGERRDVLVISGAKLPSVEQTALEWELRAAPTPYAGLHEILAVYDLGALGEHSTLEVIPFGVAFVDSASRVDGTKASISVRLAEGLSIERLTLGYRVVGAGSRVEQRSALKGTQLKWSAADGVQVGTTELTVPGAAVVDCTVSYDGIARQHWWIGDPSNPQNPRRAAYEVEDPKLEILREFIEGSGRQPQADFELAVAWLLWMLGFSPAHLGSCRRLESADILVATPQQHLAVVECTTGLLKAEHKMSRVVERTERVRRLMRQGLKVLPVIATSLPRNDVKADLEAAEKLGVLVLAREQLEELLTLRSLGFPNADALYAEAERAVRDAQARHIAEPELNLSP